MPGRVRSLALPLASALTVLDGTLYLGHSTQIMLIGAGLLILPIQDEKYGGFRTAEAKVRREV